MFLDLFFLMVLQVKIRKKQIDGKLTIHKN